MARRFKPCPVCSLVGSHKASCVASRAAKAAEACRPRAGSIKKRDRLIREARSAGISGPELARMTKLDPSRIGQIAMETG